MLSALFGRGTGILVVHDIDIAERRLAEALADADPGKAEGLRHAIEVLRGVPRSDDEVLAEWASGVIRESGIDPAHQTRAVKALRDALPGLPLATAVELAKKAI